MPSVDKIIAALKQDATAAGPAISFEDCESRCKNLMEMRAVIMKRIAQLDHGQLANIKLSVDGDELIQSVFRACIRAGSADLFDAVARVRAIDTLIARYKRSMVDSIVYMDEQLPDEL